MFKECSLNVPWMFTEWLLNIHWMFHECSLNGHWMFPECPLNVPSMFTECSLNVPWIFTECSLNVPWMVTECSLNVHWMFPECSLIITMEALCDWTRSSSPGIRRLVLLTLVLGTHVGKLYSASTLVLFFFFVSASGSWDGGSRASAQLSLNVSLNVPWMFTECSLNVH
jgi:hypothetical protein